MDLECEVVGGGQNENGSLSTLSPQFPQLPVSQRGKGRAGKLLAFAWRSLWPALHSVLPTPDLTDSSQAWQMGPSSCSHFTGGKRRPRVEKASWQLALSWACLALFFLPIPSLSATPNQVQGNP